MEKIVFKYKKETYQQKKYLDYNFINGPITCPTFKNVLHKERIRIGGAKNNPKLETWVPNGLTYHDITENEYLENYGKFNYSLHHNRRLIVIEEKDNKLSLKSNQDITYKISKVDQERSVNKNKEYFKNNEILNTEMDDKKNKLVDTLNSKVFSNKQYDNLSEILHKALISNKLSELDKGNNKE